MSNLISRPDKLVYIYNSPLPSAAANSVHVMNFCEALADEGFAVTLLAHRAKKLSNKEELFAYYGVKSNFNIVSLNVDWLPVGKQIALALLSFLYIVRNRVDLIYGRSILGTGLATVFTSIPSIFEIHNLIHQRTRLERVLFHRLIRKNNLLKVIVITNTLQEDFRKGFSDQIISDKFFVLADCATRRALKDTERVALKGNYAINIGYTGSLYRGKGADFVIKIAEELPEYAFHIVGGNQSQITSLEEQAGNNVFFYGFQPNRSVPYFITQFDVCLLPNDVKVFGHGSDKIKSKEDIGKYTSPLKLFEYMAYEKAIVASDLPVLKEVLSDNTCIFARIGDVKDWKDKIESLVNNPELKDTLAKNAHEDFLSNYSWLRRASAVRRIFQQYGGSC